MTVIKRKLIEVALPLEAINRESAREKSIRHGHPSTLHLWWARRPLAACRAVLFAQLVDDPSSHPDRFPTEVSQAKERERLFELIERLVVWENLNDSALLAQAHAEIVTSMGGAVPTISDPFAGGGSIPLEAQRLGLNAHASDLNPVAVLINKALIDLPPKWAGQPPVFPGSEEQKMSWARVTGLAEDIRRYGHWMRERADKRIGELYPKAILGDGSQANVIAWLWARSVTCPNPACGVETPLASTWWLNKKKGKTSWLKPVTGGHTVRFEIGHGGSGPGEPPKRGQGANFSCVSCGGPMNRDYVHDVFRAHADGKMLLAVVVDGPRGREYQAPSASHVAAAQVPTPEGVPDQACRGTFGGNAQGRRYGFDVFADYYTDRQLTALTTFVELLGEVRQQIRHDAEASSSGRDAAAYAAAVSTYLAFAVSRSADYWSSLVTWSSTGEFLRNTFARQAIPMTWDFAECNPLGDASGNWLGAVEWVAKAVESLPATGTGTALQADAATLVLDAGTVVCTDPPYYDNITYSDLADFFYVWLRMSTRDLYGDLMDTMLTPKAAELIANPYRFDGDRKAAAAHFEGGFVRTFTRIREKHSSETPMTVFYAFKQTEQDDGGTASTGWETMLTGLMTAGWTINATWPVRTEREGRSVGHGTNALASSVVLACRPKPPSAEAATRRTFVNSLKSELPDALRHLQQGNIAPVDLAQAAIGPGMSVFSRFSQVAEADGSHMSVRTALALINQVLDEVLSEQEGDFDAETRFCIKWFSQFGWNEGASGEADVLSRAVNTSLVALERGGVFRASAGKAQLLDGASMSEGWSPAEDKSLSVWEVAVRVGFALQSEGAERAAEWMAAASVRIDVDAVKELSYLLYSICEKKGWAESAMLFNGLGTSWPELSSRGRSPKASPVRQGEFDLDLEDDRT